MNTALLISQQESSERFRRAEAFEERQRTLGLEMRRRAATRAQDDAIRAAEGRAAWREEDWQVPTEENIHGRTFPEARGRRRDYEDYLGPAHAGPAHAGPTHAGPAHLGPVRAGPARMTRVEEEDGFDYGLNYSDDEADLANLRGPPGPAPGRSRERGGGRGDGGI